MTPVGRRRVLQGAAATLALPLLVGAATATERKTMRAIEVTAGSGHAYGYSVKTIHFQSRGEAIAGLLFRPTRSDPAPGIVVLGPFGFVKEQAPMQYATRLARDGYAVLIFDPRYSGESEGTPRRLESPSAKIIDTISALDWLTAQPGVDRARLAALGVCQGASEMIAVTAADKRVRALALVSGQYLYRENLQGFFAGGGPTLDDRVARGQAAKARFAATGVVDYIPVVSPGDKAAGLPWPPIHDWYQPWTTAKWGAPSRWENRYATMSDAEVWTFDVAAHAAKVTVPTLLVHGEQSDGGVAAVRHAHAHLAAKDKRLVVVDGVFHTRFYDDPIVVDPAAAEVAAWFDQHLA